MATNRRKYQGNPLRHKGREFRNVKRSLESYARREGLHRGPLSRGRWLYADAAADVIANILHACDGLGVDSELVMAKAIQHHAIETAERCTCGAGYDPDSTPERCEHCGGSMDLVTCAKCGVRVARDRAVIDQGEGPEAGREFAYCSEAHRRAH